jgi:hypothetical protein
LEAEMQMTGLTEVRERGRRVMIALVALNAVVTVAVLIGFAFVRTATAHSSASPYAAFVGVFLLIVILDGAIAAWGFRWFWKRSRCPRCASFLNQLVVPEKGCCQRCGYQWDLRPESGA